MASTLFNIIKSTKIYSVNSTGYRVDILPANGNLKENENRLITKTQWGKEKIVSFIDYLQRHYRQYQCTIAEANARNEGKHCIGRVEFYLTKKIDNKEIKRIIREFEKEQSKINYVV